MSDKIGKGAILFILITAPFWIPMCILGLLVIVIGFLWDLITGGGTKTNFQS